jgi:hypothetical protein
MDTLTTKLDLDLGGGLQKRLRSNTWTGLACMNGYAWENYR